MNVSSIKNDASSFASATVEQARSKIEAAKPRVLEAARAAEPYVKAAAEGAAIGAIIGAGATLGAAAVSAVLDWF